MDSNDLLLLLAQIADAPEPVAPVTGPSVLSKIKPYFSHEGCGGLVGVEVTVYPTTGEDSEGEEWKGPAPEGSHNRVEGRVTCSRCKKTESFNPVYQGVDDAKSDSEDRVFPLGGTPSWVIPPAMF